MTPFSTVMMVIHGLGAIFGIGAVTAFPFVGMAAEKYPSSAPVILPIATAIHTKVVWPAALLQLLTGAILIATLPLPLSENLWLEIAILIFIVVFAIDVAILAPLESRVIQIVQGSEKPDVQELGNLIKRVRGLGGVTSLGFLAIVILMIWHPGMTPIW